MEIRSPDDKDDDSHDSGDDNDSSNSGSSSSRDIACWIVLYLSCAHKSNTINVVNCLQMEHNSAGRWGGVGERWRWSESI